MQSALQYDSDSDIVSADSDSENFDFDVIEMDGNKFDFLN